MNTPTYCRTTGVRIGRCTCLRCTPPALPNLHYNLGPAPGAHPPSL